MAALYRSLFPKSNYKYDACERPVGEECPQPVGEECLQPVGEECLQPVGEECPQPVGEECPQPVGVTSNRVDSAMLSVIMANLASECTDLEAALLVSQFEPEPGTWTSPALLYCHFRKISSSVSLPTL